MGGVYGGLAAPVCRCMFGCCCCAAVQSCFIPSAVKNASVLVHAKKNVSVPGHADKNASLPAHADKNVSGHRFSGLFTRSVQSADDNLSVGACRQD